MVDDIPLWKHLVNGGKSHQINLTTKDFGIIAERIGTRALRINIKHNGMLDTIFPDIQILSTKKLRSSGDYTIEVNYQKGDNHGKKIVLFEIKYGRVFLSHRQTTKYCKMILEPCEFFRKADEVKIFYMIFDKLAVTGWRIFINQIKKHGGKHIHQGGLPLFVLEGKGYTIVDGVRYDWEKGDLILLPIKRDGCEHQHFNEDPDVPAKRVAFIFKPLRDPAGVKFVQVEEHPDWMMTPKR